MTYVIRFDFPEIDEPLYAGACSNGAAGFARQLETADLYDDREVAERVRRNAYPESIAALGTVVEQHDRPAVTRLEKAIEAHLNDDEYGRLIDEPTTPGDVANLP